MNDMITYCALNQMLNTIFDIKEYHAEPTTQDTGYRKVICLTNVKPRGACTTISRKI